MVSRAAYLFFALVLAMSWHSAAAQRTINGQIYTAQQEPLPGALVELQSAQHKEVSTVAIMDQAGRFTFQIDWADDSLVLSARALGFTKQVRRLANRNQALTVLLPVSSTPLKEVVVKAPPIRRQGDTLSYNVGSFTDKKDRVIADVLKKMPGIEVGADGRVFYQGQAIQKFYINGVDLLEGRYNLASNNLPADAVRDVQVLENHQPIRALDSLARSGRASLNLQLKKAVTTTGQVRLGAGLSLPLWNANLSPMLFTKKQQFLDTYQTNNTGQDVLAELKPLGLEDIRQLSETSSRKPALTGVQGLGTPPLAANRYLFNQAHLLSVNHLVTLRKETQLRVNASYLHDAQTQYGSTQTRYYLPGETVQLNEEKRNQLYFNTLQTDLALIKNDKKQYLKNVLSFNGSWDSQAGSVYRPDQPPVIQKAVNPFYTITNRLGLVRPAGGSKLLQVSSLTYYTNSPQTLAVSPGSFAEVLHGGEAYGLTRQRARLASFYTDNSASLITARGHWSYTSTLGFTQEAQRLTSALATGSAPTAEADTLRNHLRWSRGKYYVQPAVGYKKEGWNANLELPISVWTFDITDAPLAARQQLRPLTVEPHLDGRYDLGPLWYASASTGLRNQFGDIGQVNYAYILRDYRTLQRNAAPLSRNQTWSTTLGVYYKNPLKSLFYHVSYGFSTTASNRLYNNQVQPNGTLSTVAIAQPNQLVSHSVSGNVSKFIIPFKTTLSLTFSTRYARRQQLLESALQQVRNQSSTGTFKATASAFAWGSLEYSTTVTVLRNRVENAPQQPLTVLQDHHAQVSLYPLEHHQLLFYTDYYATQGLGTPVRNLFADVVYRYALSTKRKMDFEIKWSNLFNTRLYQYSYADQFVLIQNQYRLRPAQVLLAVRVSL